MTSSTPLIDNKKRAWQHGDAKRYKSIFDHALSFYGLLDPDGTLVEINQTALGFSGQKREAIIGSLFWETPWWRGDDKRVSELKGAVQLAAGGESVRYQVEINCVNDIRLPIDFSLKPIPDDNGTIANIIAEGWDISELMETEESLRINEKRYRTLYNSTPVMLHSIGPDGRLLSVSDFWLERLGYERHEVIGKHSADFLTPESRIKAQEALLPQFFAEGRCKDIEYRYITKSGRTIDVLMSAVAEYDRHGNFLKSMAVSTDMTERKEVERQLLQAQKMESVGQLTGGLAHDFNNLLGVVLGNLQLIERAVDTDEEVLKRIHSAQAAVEKGAELTRRLLAFSRRQPLEAELIEPKPLLENLSEMLQRTLGEEIALECHFTDNMPRIRTDPSQLESAILNLAVNARDAMPDGGALTIEGNVVKLDGKYAVRNQIKPGEYVQLAVTDTGKGIPADMINQVFEPFFTTKETGKGSGLGLSMVYGFIKQIGGHVSIYSEPGHGTTIRLYLPVDRNNQAKLQRNSNEETSAIEGGNEIILVVEDQADVRDVAAALLKDLGYRVLTAVDGPSGLEMLMSRNDIDLLFTDMVMPGGMSGASLANAARELRPNFPVVFTTGYADAAVLRESQIAETGNLVTKPYRRDKLGEKIRRALDGVST